MEDALQSESKLSIKSNKQSQILQGIQKPQVKPSTFNVIHILPEHDEKKKKQIEKELFDIFKKYS